MTNKDYYEVIGVAKTATQDEIKRAFKKKAAELHPDNKDSGDESAFKDLVAAYEVLSDESKRSLYDRYGAEGVKGSSRFGGGGGMDMGGFGDLSDIFEYFFGGAGMRGQPRRRNEPAQGNDLRYDMELDFLEGVFGVEKKISYQHLEDCTECKATGAAPGSQPVTCVACAGMGQVRHTSSTFFGNFTQVMPCPTCDGQGTKIDRPCEICKGHGQVRKTRTCDLKVPAGVNNGARLHVVGAGDQGRKGAPPGDLYVVLHVKPHSRFEREGYTIHLRQPVSFAMAALGGEMLVDTVGGPHLLKIPAGVQTGHTLIMKDLGVPHLRSNQKRGDQQVHLHIETPTKLTDEQKQLLKQFSELRGESLNVSPDQQPKTPEGQQSIFDVIAGVFKPKNGGDE